MTEEGSSPVNRPAEERGRPEEESSLPSEEPPPESRPIRDAASPDSCPVTEEPGEGREGPLELEPLPEPRERFLNRELTWLAFNGRVLQEAMDPRVPLYERLKFLAIFSSNLDEFFRVRVASLRSLLRLKKKKLKKLDFRPARLLRDIRFVVTSQQETFGSVFRGEILPGLEARGIFLLNEGNLTTEQEAFARRHVRNRVLPHLEPRILDEDANGVFLEEGAIYLVVELWPGAEMTLAWERPGYALMDVPSPPLPRFVVLPGEGHNVIFLDDAIRLHLDELFPEYEVGSAFAVKLNRDADLYLEDEFEGNLVKKIRKSLEKRETGFPSRFLYDLQAPYALVAFMKEYLALEDEDLVPGGRYHSLQDLFHFPRPRRRAEGLVREPLEPLPHPELRRAGSVLEAATEKDHILHFPYQSFDYVVRFLEEAAEDPAVDAIWITLYRVAENSAVVKALMEAARRGARVVAFVEVKARFDEARNLDWAEEMARAGVHTVYSMPGIKVHAKLALVSRREEDGRRLLAYLGTGNFNENTARVYADHGLLTADPRLTEEVHEVFRYLQEEIDEPNCRHLMVAPFHLRSRLARLVCAEVEAAREGDFSGLVLKTNSLEDEGMIDLLYRAAEGGVMTQLVIRGICRMRPGLPRWGENVTGRSIVDRFLEHARIFRFVNRARPLLFLSSADLMKRNLDERVEVAFPVYDPGVKGELEHFLHLQLSDNTKARVLDREQENHYVGRRAGEPRVEAQESFYRWLQERLDSEGEKGEP
jgi:polyphosphate kinase